MLIFFPLDTPCPDPLSIPHNGTATLNSDSTLHGPCLDVNQEANPQSCPGLTIKLKEFTVADGVLTAEWMVNKNTGITTHRIFFSMPVMGGGNVSQSTKIQFI